MTTPRFAADRLEVLHRLCQEGIWPGDIESALDALHIVPTGSASCLEDFVGITGPDGDWSWGAYGDELPPWISESELCPASQQ